VLRTRGFFARMSQTLTVGSSSRRAWSIWSRSALSYVDLAQRMEVIGLKVNDRTLANKIATGSFSTVFFLQCMEAIGVRSIQLDTGD
jgi:hypothetical protein